MSNDQNDKATIPPPLDDDSGDGADERTVLATVPEELIAESLRGEQLEREKEPSSGGLRQMFGHDPNQVREAVPTDAEGDALLDMLFDDATEVRSGSEEAAAEDELSPQPEALAPPLPPPAAPAPRGALAPPLPPRPSVPLDADEEPTLYRPAPPRPAPSRPQAPPRPRPSQPDAAEAAGSATATPLASVGFDDDEPTAYRAKPVPLGGDLDEPTIARQSSSDEAATIARDSGADIAASELAPGVADVGDAEIAAFFDEAMDMGGGDETEAPAAADRSDEDKTHIIGHKQLQGAPGAGPPRPRPSAPEAAQPDEEEDFFAVAERAADALVGEPEEGQLEASFDEADVAPEDDAPGEPVFLPSRPPEAASFPDEQLASTHLEMNGARDMWVERARWLREEAEHMDDRAARARTLLVVSELYAMAGEDEEAAVVAKLVHDLAPSAPMSARHYRAFLTRTGDDKAVMDALDHETRLMPTPAARAHGAWLGAEIARLRLGDAQGASRRCEQALRAHPTDPRGHLQRVVEALAEADVQGASLAKLRPAEGEELQLLSDAISTVAAWRGAFHADGPTTPYEAVLAARAKVAAGDAAGAAEALAALDKTSLAAGAGWVRAALTAPKSESRGRAVAAMRKPLEGSHSAFARRTLAALAIESGDPQAALTAAASTDSDAFTQGDQLALAALSGAKRADVETLLQSAVYDPDLLPLGAAFSAVNAEAGELPLPFGGEASRLAANLGRLLGGAASDPGSFAELELADVATELLEAEPDARVARVVALEVEADRGDVEATVRGVLALRADPDGERDRNLAAALLADGAGLTELAVSSYQAAIHADPSCEVAYRAMTVGAAPEQMAASLSELAAGLTDTERSAMALSEAGMRLALAELTDEAGEILRRAAELDPKLPFAVHLGERAARAQGDRDGLVEWLRIRREASDDVIERAHDLVREALLVSDAEGSPAAPLLEEALAARAEDVGLRDLYERLAYEPPVDRASWREERAAAAEGEERARLALEAAFDYEREGQLEAAYRCTQTAMAAGEHTLSPLLNHRLALAGHGTGDLIDALLPVAREAEDPVLRRETYERMAELDELGRNDVASGVLWRRSLLEENPGDLPTLRRLAASLIDSGRDDELEPIAFEIAKALDGGEAVAHAALSARLRLRSSWEETKEPVSVAYTVEPRGLWVLRQAAAHARAEGDHWGAMIADQQLLERTGRDSERATLALRAAEDARAAGELQVAKTLLTEAATLSPQHLIVGLLLGEVLEELGEHVAAAERFELAATCAGTAAEQAGASLRAAVLWQEHAGDPGRARAALERVVDLDAATDAVYERLQAIYIEAGARGELADLLTRRLDAITDPDRRVEMEVLRGRALADVGDAGSAKRALAAALEANPDHVDALSAFAELCEADEDYESAEQALIRLARLVTDGGQQAAIYLRLGALYDDKIPNPERAEMSYQEILKRRPDDASARERLVELYKRTGQIDRAIEQQNVLVNAASTPDEKCQRTLGTASIHEAAGDHKKAEATLVAARKAHPKNAAALTALVRYYQRNDQGQAAQVLLDRAAADARRALGTGRFEPFLFDALSTVAELRGRPEAARIAAAAVASLQGETVELAGVGSRAGDRSLDEYLAPDVMTEAFRELLKRTGPLLDTAFPYDLGSIRAAPLSAGPIADEIQTLAAAYGLSQVTAYTTSVLGSVCIAASAHPAAIVLGESIVASPRADVRTFLIHRALKVIQSNAVVFARTAPIDLWPLLAAYLKAFNQNWTPQGIDNSRLTDAYGKITRSMTSSSDAQVPLLSAEVIGSIGNRASTLNTVVNGWGNRAGLLAMGDPNVALSGIAWSGGHTNAPPSGGKERFTWVGRNAEARELIVFAVSDPYAEARSKLGA